MERPRIQSKKTLSELLRGAGSIGEGIDSIGEGMASFICPRSLNKTLRNIQEQARSEKAPFVADIQASRGDWEQIGRDFESILGKKQ